MGSSSSARVLWYLTSMEPTHEMIQMQKSRTLWSVLPARNPWKRSNCVQECLLKERMHLVLVPFSQYLNPFPHRSKPWLSWRNDGKCEWKIGIAYQSSSIGKKEVNGTSLGITKYLKERLVKCRICIYFQNRIFQIKIAYGGVVSWHISEPITFSTKMNSTLHPTWFRLKR